MNIELYLAALGLLALGFLGGWAWARLTRERPGWTDVPVVSGYEALETLRRAQGGK